MGDVGFEGRKMHKRMHICVCGGPTEQVHHACLVLRWIRETWVQDASDVTNVAEVGKEGSHVAELCVVHVAEPR